MCPKKIGLVLKMTGFVLIRLDLSWIWLDLSYELLDLCYDKIFKLKNTFFFSNFYWNLFSMWLDYRTGLITPMNDALLSTGLITPIMPCYQCWCKKNGQNVLVFLEGFIFTPIPPNQYGQCIIQSTSCGNLD